MGPGSPAPDAKGKRSAELPEIGFCKEKHQLLARFVEAVKEIGRLQAEQMKTILRGAPEVERFEPLLNSAIQKKDAAKYALLVHIEAHHC